MGRSPARWRCCRRRPETQIARGTPTSVRAARPSLGTAVLLVAVLGACARGPVEHPAPYAPDAHDALVGLDGEALLARLGEPEMLRRERGAEYWRYRHHGCLIDIFLFADPPTAAPRIIHVGVRRLSGAAAVGAGSCETVAAEFATGEERLPGTHRSY